MKSEQFISFGKVQVGENVYFYNGCRLGLPKEQRVNSHLDFCQSFTNDTEINKLCKTTTIGDRSIIGADAVIYEGTYLGKTVILEDKVRLGFGCSIGAKSRIMYGAYICDRVIVGNVCRIAGFVCDAVKIGNRSTVMGNLVHSYTVPDESWGVEEPAPIVGDDCVIGYGATVVGGIKIGNYSYVGAGAIVTKDVPPETIVIGHDERKKISEWRGTGLRELFLRRSV